ncbi:unnamed protein product [Rotaria magnacalcarata]|uniref:Peptidase S1 domain-containing protein n=1 Tax=Rotaria magnacalcarata TaxID=392030 RepID=A0A815NUH6_9BILA|nr:unnamed protein product [Rotaria magnacalcarata]CAF1578522.1 unnamed protein product [Rotaria magnacalcarata]CAF2263267.1 unnamed protein product [Rotaria magnacalcarata]CAF3811585.1 unnamed protein product [Rotaria magnacalcarata]CAF3824349.1 unnamed protein product [Rotaria magnacalcarata]
MIYILFMCTIVQYVGVHGDDYDQIRHYSSMHHNMQQFYHPPTSYFRHYTHNNPPQSIFLRNWLLANNADALSMQNCGISPATNIYQRIVGGRPTMPYAYPWMVFLTIESIDGKFECAGALLTRLHVLTAAHCVTKSEYPKAVTVKAGIYNRTDKVKPVPARIITMFPDYNYKTHAHDIAIITLEYLLPCNDPSIGTICLPPDNVGDNYPKPGWSSVAIGWGCTSWNDCQTQTLQEANLPILHANIPPCTQHMIYPPGQICAGNFKCVAGTCKGDSGGPLMIQNANYRWEVIGITSCDDKCGKPNTPGIYTRVSFYNDFIRSTIVQSNYDPKFRSCLFSSSSTFTRNRSS